MEGNIAKEDFLKAEQAFYKDVHNINEDIRRYKCSLIEHEQAIELLKQLHEKTRHNIMVPLGPLAFMPGQLIHTNEVTVLLGENYFIERSASQAAAILTRRKVLIDELISSSEAKSRKLSARAHTADYARKSLFQHFNDTTAPVLSTGQEDESDETGSEDDGKGYEFWTNAGFVGAWSEQVDVNDSRKGRKDSTGENSDLSSHAPVFEILEPLEGGPGRVIRHRDQDDFEGLGQQVNAGV